MSNYISNLDSAIVKLKSRYKRDASKRLLPQEREALIVSVGMITIPVIIASVLILVS